MRNSTTGLVSVGSQKDYDCQKQHTNEGKKKNKNKKKQKIRRRCKIEKEKELVRDRRKASRYLNQYSMYIDVCISSEYYKGELERPLYVCMCVCFIMIIFQ